VSSVSLAILLFGPSLIVHLSDKASTAADRPPLSEGDWAYVRARWGFATLTADQLTKQKRMTRGDHCVDGRRDRSVLLSH